MAVFSVDASGALHVGDGGSIPPPEPLYAFLETGDPNLVLMEYSVGDDSPVLLQNSA